MRLQKQKTKQSGFNLVEMSMVMAVIGLILGAVSLGNNLHQTAERQKLYQFVQGWAEAYNEYYARTGVVVGDDLLDPTLYINQATVPPVALGIALCEDNDDPAISNPGDLHDIFDQAGIAMPLGRAEGREDRFAYLDSNDNPMEIKICFRSVPWLEFDSAGNQILRLRNAMQISGLNPDVANMLDGMIDGNPDAGVGVFREGLTPAAAGNAPLTRPWSIDNRSTFGTTNTANLDEDQVAVVFAYYRMNQ